MLVASACVGASRPPKRTRQQRESLSHWPGWHAWGAASASTVLTCFKAPHTAAGPAHIASTASNTCAHNSDHAHTWPGRIRGFSTSLPAALTCETAHPSSRSAPSTAAALRASDIAIIFIFFAAVDDVIWCVGFCSFAETWERGLSLCGRG